MLSSDHPAQHPDHDLVLHSGCGHTTWYPKPAPPRLPLLCPACAQAQKALTRSCARLIASPALNRITAIGFGKPRKDELKGLGFRWHAEEYLWAYHPSNESLEGPLRRFAERLRCAKELITEDAVPPYPQELPPTEQVQTAPPPPNTSSVTGTDWLTCYSTPIPGDIGAVWEDAKGYCFAGRIPWPPSPAQMPEANHPVAGRLLIIPELSDLSRYGFTRGHFLDLLAGCFLHGVALATSLRGLNTCKIIELADSLPHGPSQALRSVPRRSGRPASAMARSAEVLLAAQGGKSAAQIAHELGISSRSVRRILTPEPAKS